MGYWSASSYEYQLSILKAVGRLGGSHLEDDHQQSRHTVASKRARSFVRLAARRTSPALAIPGEWADSSIYRSRPNSSFISKEVEVTEASLKRLTSVLKVRELPLNKNPPDLVQTKEHRHSSA